MMGLKALPYSPWPRQLINVPPSVRHFSQEHGSVMSDTQKQGGSEVVLAELVSSPNCSGCRAVVAFGVHTGGHSVLARLFLSNDPAACGSFQPH
jgi:hypothetical protein